MGRFGFDHVLLGLAWVSVLGFGAWTSTLGPAAGSRIEAELTDRARLGLDALGFGWARVRFDGMHATLTGAAPTPEQQQQALAAVRAAGALPLPAALVEVLPAGLLGAEGPVWNGVASLTDQTTRLAPVSPYTLRAEKLPDMGISITGHVPDAAMRERLIASAETLFPGRVSLELDFADGAPKRNWPEAVEATFLALSECGGQAELADTTLTLRNRQPPVADKLGTFGACVEAPVLPEGYQVVIIPNEPAPETVAPSTPPNTPQEN